MPSNATETADVRCAREPCERAAGFRVYHPPADRWRPLCTDHTRSLHPSLEIKAWLESGYAKPAELGDPDGGPTPPETGRQSAFREMVKRAMGWEPSGQSR